MHSGLEDIARTARLARGARAASAGIVLGTRLAVLAPLPRLGLIVVDEEHDASFKQQEGLRYSARDAAVYRAQARRLPGGPRHRDALARDLAQLAPGPLRAARAPGARRARRAAAAVRTVDLRTRAARNRAFARTSSRRSASASRDGEQSLVFINRRGYAPVLACEACGWTAGCERCTARMVLHSADERGSLRCHHCGAAGRDSARLPDLRQRRSEADGPRHATRRGDAAARFPDARIVRIDRDSARRRERARAHAGGHPPRRGRHPGRHAAARQGPRLPDLTLVGVLNADSALVSTDYRAAERLFAVLAQVAGRAGPARASGRSADPDALSRPSAVRRARAPRLRRLRRVAARRAPQRRLPAVRVRGRAARRGDEARPGDRIPARARRRWSQAPEEVTRLRPGAAPPHAPRGLRARAARDAVGAPARRCRSYLALLSKHLFEHGAARRPLAPRRRPDRVRLKFDAFQWQSDPESRNRRRRSKTPSTSEARRPDMPERIHALERPKQASHGDFASQRRAAARQAA